MSAPGFLEAYNARSFSPREVAKTFVPSQNFLRLCGRSHAIVVGPRGSGKTTLLKMLQQAAIEAWEHPEKDRYVEKLQFTGIFVPADISWGSQLALLGSRTLGEETEGIIGGAAFTTHVLRAQVRAMKYRVGREVQTPVKEWRRATLVPAREEELVTSLAKSWQLQPAVRSLRALEASLDERLLAIGQLAHEELALGDAGRCGRLALLTFLFLPLIESVVVGIKEFERFAGLEEEKWAFLFDELEVAPVAVRKLLLRALRSTDDRLVFKLAMSPCGDGFEGLREAASPSAGDDFTEIRLWYSDRIDIQSNCKGLWAALLRQKGLPDLDAEEILGRSPFYTPLEEWKDAGTAYRPESRLGKQIASLAIKDETFAAYLAKVGVSPHWIHRLTPEKRSATIRKVAPLIPIREYYRESDEARRRFKFPRMYRTRRKTPEIFTGADALFAVTEANPRWFIGMIGPLLDSLQESLTIDRDLQMKAIKEAGQRFLARLSHTPTPLGFIKATRGGLIDLLDSVGEYFHEACVAHDFTPDPVSTFVVDRKVPREILDGLAQAVNIGALVLVDGKSNQLTNSSLVGRRLRLCYLLAPYYGIPFRLGKAIRLSTLLSRRVSPDQEVLFGSEWRGK
jgi:energy-coupling factor transporter ATP-binding protein EcfA2